VCAMFDKDSADCSGSAEEEEEEREELLNLEPQQHKAEQLLGCWLGFALAMILCILDVQQRLLTM